MKYKSKLGLYLLDGKKVVRCPDLFEWGRWMQRVRDDRIVARTVVGNFRISTVFLGLDHGYQSRQPVLWETMVFVGKKWDGPCQEADEFDCNRCSGSWEQAEAMHEAKVKEVQQALHTKERYDSKTR